MLLMGLRAKKGGADYDFILFLVGYKPYNTEFTVLRNFFS